MSAPVKPSIYNHRVDLPHGGYLLYNAVSGSLVELDRATGSEVAPRLASGTLSERDAYPMVEQLVRGGFLVPEQLDELAMLRMHHYASRFSHGSLGLTLIPTLHCNFACTYCYQCPPASSQLADGVGEMSAATCENIVRYCDRNVIEKGMLSVCWYGGEPLLRPQVMANISTALIDCCSRRGAQFCAGVVTNGLLLRDELVQLLQSIQVTLIQVTLDGPAVVHDTRRPRADGLGSYSAIVENLERLPPGYPPSLTIRVNVDRRNRESIGALLTDLQARGLQRRENVSIYFSNTLPVATSCADLAGACMGSREFGTWMASAYRLAMDCGFRVSAYPVPVIGTCGAVNRSALVIEPDGTVQKCWNAVGCRELAVGQLGPDGIEATPLFAKWLGWSPFTERCEHCGLLPVCMGGCPFQLLYPDRLQLGAEFQCSTWQQGLGAMLDVYREARGRGLLALRPVETAAT